MDPDYLETVQKPEEVLVGFKAMRDDGWGDTPGASQVVLLSLQVAVGKVTPDGFTVAVWMRNP